MASKEEKLAAARKKLKEFQGKQRDNDHLKGKNLPATAPYQQLSSHLPVDSSSSHISFAADQMNSSFENRYTTKKCNSNTPINQPQLIRGSQDFVQTSVVYKKPPNSPIDWSGESANFISLPSIGNSSVINNIKNTKIQGEGFTPSVGNSNGSNLIDSHLNSVNESPLVDDNQSYPSNNISSRNLQKIDGSVTPELDCNKKHLSSSVITFSPKENDVIIQSGFRDSSTCNLPAGNTINDIIKPLQVELENHAQTINILVQQKNEVQNALTQAQNIITQKSEETSQQAQQIVNLTITINNMKQKLLEAESAIKNLKMENENKAQHINETHSKLQALKVDFDSKNEEFLELKKKYDEKCKECRQLVYSLNETQSQLSLCQIQIQNHLQPNADEKSDLLTKLKSLESEKVQLKQDLEKLKKDLETLNLEKDYSSQHFKAYAQQCNAEIESLNTQIKDLAATNEKLKQINEMTSARTPEVEASERNVGEEDLKSEMASLHVQITDLNEAKNELQKKCQEREKENSALKRDAMEKEVQIQSMAEILKDLESENKRLLLESDSPKADERLLAAMESDKVAAAKAVSQNQKLKSQVMELEEAFVKLSEEKLELTNQLSHEKHLSKELKNKLEEIESFNQENEDHVHHHECEDQYHGHNCHDGHDHNDDEIEPLVNDSQEIDELKRIIRQLQDDKMELKSRLNLLVPMENALQNDRKEDHHSPSNVEFDDEEPQDAKIRLQQMEEKVRKTMNEIAILDEEKEKLEHLVMQLQGETETIGEYITLYQKQRMLLKQRAIEKDSQLMQLSKDKEELKSKLDALDELVQNLLREKNDGIPGPEKRIPLPESLIPPVEEDNTVGKIRALINEIGSTNLISNQSVAFKHCSCCSGRLMTI